MVMGRAIFSRLSIRWSLQHMPESNRSETIAYTGAIAVTILGFYLCSLYSYLLFHSLIEIVTIAIAFTLFILTLNTRKYLPNDYFKLLGIGYAFIALIDLIHSLAYKGMNVFPGFGANLPTQLWIAARYLQAITLCIAPLLVERRINIRIILAGYIAATSLLLAIIYSGNFPDCFIEGKGLTTFKIGSEYLISVILLVSLYLLYRKREVFNRRVYLLLLLSISCTVLSEISFTAYVSVYGFANMVGHFAKLSAFYLIYRAILVTGIKEPFELVFKDLKQAEEALRKSQDDLERKVRERTVALEISLAERKEAEKTIHLKATALEEEVSERQAAQETLQEQALLLEEEIDKRQKSQNELEKLNESLEQRVKERTAELERKNVELERMNRLFVGRELRMVELKERIREFEQHDMPHDLKSAESDL